MLDDLSFTMISKLSNPEVIKFIQDHINDDPFKLALAANKFPDLPIKEIAAQITSRQKARTKLPEWFRNEKLIFPPKENLEQASSEITARFKSRWVEGKSIVDLTGGSGIDLFYLSANFDSAYYVEVNEDLVALAKHNFGIFDKKISVYSSSAEDFLRVNTQQFDVIYIDPSRRNNQKNRVINLQDYQPNVIEIYDQLLKTGKEIIIKTSPMIDIKQTIELLPDTHKIQVVSVDNEVKEVLFYINAKTDKEPIIEAWNISNSNKEQFLEFMFSDEQSTKIEYSIPRSYLYDANSAIRKSGAFNLIGSSFNLKKVHPNTHLYTSNEKVDDFPGRSFKILKSIKPTKKEIKKVIPYGKINVISKNFPMGANEIKKKFQLHDGGEEFLIFCTQMDEAKLAFYCKLDD